MFLALEEVQEMTISPDRTFIPGRGRSYGGEICGFVEFYNFVGSCESRCPESDEFGNIDHDDAVKA